MFNSPIWLSVLTAILASSYSESTSSSSKLSQKTKTQVSLVIDEEQTEAQKINEESKRMLGRELLQR